jgi:hypothetical protein
MILGDVRKYKSVAVKTVRRKIAKRMGRPPVGSKLISVRVPPDQLAELVAWTERQPTPGPSLPEAMRRLTGKALACEQRKTSRT